MQGRKRMPVAWFAVPVLSIKVKKNRQLALLPKRTAKRGRSNA